MSDNKKNCYLFVHFKEKSTPDGEQVYFGISRDGVAGRGGQRGRGCSRDVENVAQPPKIEKRSTAMEM